MGMLGLPSNEQTTMVVQAQRLGGVIVVNLVLPFPPRPNNNTSQHVADMKTVPQRRAFCYRGSCCSYMRKPLVLQLHSNKHIAYCNVNAQHTLEFFFFFSSTRPLRHSCTTPSQYSEFGASSSKRVRVHPQAKHSAWWRPTIAHTSQLLLHKTDVSQQKRTKSGMTQTCFFFQCNKNTAPSLYSVGWGTIQGSCAVPMWLKATCSSGGWVLCWMGGTDHAESVKTLTTTHFPNTHTSIP